MKIKFKGIKTFVSIFFLISIACSLSSAPATEAPLATGVANPATVPPVQHAMTPPGTLPVKRSGLAGDYDSSTTASENRAPSGDRFTFGRFERPFNATTMDIYYPNLDIQNTIFYQDDTWIYAVIELKDDSSPQTLVGKYGFEIDLDLDGGGDILVMGGQPASSTWTTEGVQVWVDTNRDVGGSEKALTDPASSSGNGYETKLFGDGEGDDQDLAWVRISPDNPNTVELAAKTSLLNGDKTYMIGMWAGGEDFNPALFDINDHFSHEQAGTALKELENFYPIKEVFELDNACKMAIGFEPTGDEPGLCPITVVPAVPGSEPGVVPGCIDYGGICSAGTECCNSVPCTGGRCRYP